MKQLLLILCLAASTAGFAQKKQAYDSAAKKADSLTQAPQDGRQFPVFTANDFYDLAGELPGKHSQFIMMWVEQRFYQKMQAMQQQPKQQPRKEK